MNRLPCKTLLMCAFGLLASSSPAAPDPRGAWKQADPAELRAVRSSAAHFRLDMEVQRSILLSAPMERTKAADLAPIITLPRPDGSLEGFTIVESPVMQPELAVRFPEIRTYSAQSIENPAATARMTINELGFFATVLSPDGDYCVAPLDLFPDALYASDYSKNNAASWECGTRGEPVAVPPDPFAATTADKLRTYVIGVGMDPRMCVNICGGTVAGGLSGVVTAVNAINAVWEKEVAIRFTLVATNDLAIFTDTAANPWDTANNNDMMASNGGVLESTIGLANIDIGHVMAWMGGGVANLGVVCSNSKANGLSGNMFSLSSLSNPQTMMHEIGHQFNAPHSWNGAGGSCTSDQFDGSASFEPGSGSTIMSYAGSCSPDNVQNFRDNYYSQGSLQQITDFSASRTCSDVTATGNKAPVVSISTKLNAPVPVGTPFELIGSATDPDGDPLTFTWEQRQPGSRKSLSAGDTGTGPLFRSFPPSAAGSRRTFPKLSTILTGNLAGSLGEIMPTRARTLIFRLTARDNRAGGGGQSSDDVQIKSYITASPFLITSPNTTAAQSGATVVRWSVGDTTKAPFNHDKVDILLSTDGGNTFPTVLRSAVPNNGAAGVALPNTATSCRVRVQPVGAIYFDISNASFSVTAPPAGARVASAASLTLDDAFATGNANGFAEPGESRLRVYFDVLSSGSLAATGVHATVQTSTPTATVTLGSVDFPDMARGDLARNLLPAVVAISPAHPCGTAVQLTVNITANEGSWSLAYSLPTGNAGICQPAKAWCPGDFNSDGLVDDADFTVFVVAYDALENAAGDLNGDTLTTDEDFSVFTVNYDALVCP